jgi:hypothetical protein
MNLLASPQKASADHINPTFSADGTKIEIQSADVEGQPVLERLRSFGAQNLSQSDV